jgi:hypothetical protein
MSWLLSLTNATCPIHFAFFAKWGRSQRQLGCVFSHPCDRKSRKDGERRMLATRKSLVRRESCSGGTRIGPVRPVSSRPRPCAKRCGRNETPFEPAPTGFASQSRPVTKVQTVEMQLLQKCPTSTHFVRRRLHIHIAECKFPQCSRENRSACGLQ